MSHEQSMSMSDEPQEETMSMGEPDRRPCPWASRTRSHVHGRAGPGAMSMGEPDQETMSMGQPDEDSM